MKSIFINKPFDDISEVDLSEESLKSISIILVSPGAGAVNMFGHLLLHLHLTNEEDIVISYRGHVDDYKMSSWKGITGGYKVKPFTFRISRAIYEYTTNLGRSFSSFPLNLSSQELNALRLSLLSDYWTMNAPYNFIYNNCSSNIGRILRNNLKSSGINSFNQNFPNQVITALNKKSYISLDNCKFFKNLEIEKEEVLVSKFAKSQKRSEELLSKAKNLDFSSLGFNKVTLLEVIREQFELNREYRKIEEMMNLHQYKNAIEWVKQQK